MKAINYILLTVAGTLCLASCDNFLDTQSLTKKNTGNFPANETDAYQMVAGIYTVMNNNLSDPESDPFYVFELAGDDRLGGGSQSNIGAQGMDRLMSHKKDAFERFWSARYKGIFRANNAIATMDNVQGWTSENVKRQLLGEAYFLRAFYYFNFAQVFGEVPLILTTEAVNAPKASSEEIYAQIASDLKMAINTFPASKYPEFGEGHASKWVAEAMMARVWLFYTGFYGKSELPLAEGGSVSKNEVVAWLEDCIKNSGHRLVSDQRNLWPYTNPYTAKDYPYAQAAGLVWESDENAEIMFSVKMSNKASFAAEDLRHNRVVEYFNPRKAGASSFPFNATGYSNGPVCESLWLDWGSDPDYAGDYRRTGSICKRADELPAYKGDAAKEVENTDLLAKKYLGCGAYEGESLKESYAYFYGGENNKQTGLTQALVWLRFADVLLMHSELTDGAVIYNGKSGLNAVRQRANLPDINYSLANLKKERRFELCFEALRWNDLRRWGDVEEIVKNQEGNKILNQGVEGVYQWQAAHPFMERYNATGGGFFKIPESQITLSEDVLVQNPGRDSSADFIKGDLPYYKK